MAKFLACPRKLAAFPSASNPFGNNLDQGAVTKDGEVSEGFMSTELKRATHPFSIDVAAAGPAVATAARAAPAAGRLAALDGVSGAVRARVDQLVALAGDGLGRMHDGWAFGHTLRAVKTGSGWSEKLEGDSLRYAAMVALGLSHTDEQVQRRVLGNGTASDLAKTCAERAERSTDAGAIALSAWAAAEAGRFHAANLFEKLGVRIASPEPLATVECAWAVIAALAAERFGDTEKVAAAAASRLMEAQSQAGLFPHLLPASASGRLRAHIGCYADQVYPIQALARLSVARSDALALAAADACAARICALQGPAGQWWWHYDTRDGKVVEGYPVYSVHQHAMGPMALLDLMEAGGAAHWQPIVRGLGWLDTHPETVSSLVCPEKGVIWRKVARRERAKAARAIAAVTTAASPGLHLPLVNAIFPPGEVDHECRPYELGWLLYAWKADGVIASLSRSAAGGVDNRSEEA